MTKMQADSFHRRLPIDHRYRFRDSYSYTTKNQLKSIVNYYNQRSAEVFLEEEPFMETFGDDDKTTTKAPTTTTPTTTVAPDFQCFMCQANSNGNVTGEYQIICDANFDLRISRHEF